MRIRTKITALVAAVLSVSFGVCGAFSVNQYMNSSVRRLADSEAEKMAVAQWAFEQMGSRGELEGMVELAREAYLKYQFARCYQDGYALMDGDTCVENLTGYEIVNGGALNQRYTVQQVGENYLLLMRGELEYPEGFWVMSARDITEAWTEARRQALQYLAVFACTFCAAMAVTVWILRRMLGVLEQLRAQAEAIGQGDFSRKTTVETRDELAKLSEGMNQMSDKIQQQIEDLQILLGAMAHETKTPVTSIIGYADTLLNVRLSAGQRERALQAIQRSAWRLDKLSGKLMQLIGLYENQQLSMEPVSLEELLSQSCGQARQLTAGTGIRISLDVKKEGEQSHVITGDKLLLGVLFDNLLTNAVKAFDGQGEILVCCSGRTVTVEDNGRGIPEADLPHVFKAFYMADKSRARRQQGSGLGLALVERIAALHHAKVTIESQVGKGTRVTVEFGVDEKNH